MYITEALAQLDPKNDDHWTSDGLPLMGAIYSIMGTDDITRKEVSESMPDFTREVALAALGDQPDPPADPEPEFSDEGKSKLEIVRERINEIDAQNSELGQLRDQTQAQIDGLDKERSKLQSELDASQGGEDDTSARMNYIKKQNQLRVERAEKHKQLQQMGLSLGVMTGKAPIDQAMSRKNGRGTERPNRASLG